MNYAKVIADFASGILDREKITLVFDNDGGYWAVKFEMSSVDPKLIAKAKVAAEKYFNENAVDDISVDEFSVDEFIEDYINDTFVTELEKKYGTPGGYGDLIDLALAAGINAEWA